MNIEKQPSMPSESENPQRALFNFIGVTILVAIPSLLIGIFASIFSYLIYIVFLFPLFMGFFGGKIVANAVRVAKARKTSQLVFFSLLAALTIYGTFHYGRYVGLQVQMSLEMFPGLSAATRDDNFKIASAVVDYALEQETGHSGFIGYMLLRARKGVSIGRFYQSSRVNLGPILTWLYWILEFAIILWVTFSMGRKQISMPFCEFCRNWYNGEKHLGGTAAANGLHVLELIKQKDFPELGKLIEENAELPSLEIYFQGCERCNQGQSRLILRRASQDSKGMLKFMDISQTVLPAGDGARLLNQLKFTQN